MFPTTGIDCFLIGATLIIAAIGSLRVVRGPEPGIDPAKLRAGRIADCLVMNDLLL